MRDRFALCHPQRLHRRTLARGREPWQNGPGISGERLKQAPMVRPTGAELWRKASHDTGAREMPAGNRDAD